MREPLAKLYVLFIAVSLLTVWTSIDKAYSLDEFKHESLKGLVVFLVIATTFADRRRMLWFCAACAVSSFLMVSTGYYSYVVKDVPLLKPDVSFMHLWHNRFARYLCMTLPFAAVLLPEARGRWYRYAGVAFLVASVFALILSTSRGAYAALLAMIAIWFYFLFRRRQDMIRLAAAAVAMVIVISAAAWFMSPGVQERVEDTARELSTMNNRTGAWASIVEGIRERPLLGWGHGSKLVRYEEPYRETDSGPPDIGAHNTFLMITFNSGLIGLLSYVTLLVFTSVFCVRRLVDERLGRLERLLLLASLSIIVGNYLVHALLENVSFKDLSIVLGIVMASKNRSR